MRKEVLYAIIFGIILGAVILFGINLANNAARSFPSPSGLSAGSFTPTPSVRPKTLEIISPQDHTVTTEKTLILSGQTTPSADLAIITEVDDLLLQAGPEGTFSAQINLIAGENTLTVTHLLSDRTVETKTITVIQLNSLPE